ncbi:cupin domain-containing protein [Sphingobacterium sp.]|uniref:cupin domain-containing protein n=1 Tax=Sphingobacterium sp. TaxID=341027 RepID=UPI0031CE65E7
MTSSKTKFCVTISLLLSFFSCKGQEAQIQRNELQNILLDQQLHKIETQEITLPKAQETPKHFHPCPVIGIIISGEIIFEIAGQEPKILKSGETFYEPKNTFILKFNNNSKTSEARFIAIYLKAHDEKSIEFSKITK